MFWASVCVIVGQVKIISIFESDVCVCECSALWLTSQRVSIYFGLSFARGINKCGMFGDDVATVGRKHRIDDANDDDAMLSQLTISIISRCRFRNSPIRYRFYLKNRKYRFRRSCLVNLVVNCVINATRREKKHSLAQRQSMNVGTTTSFQLHCSTNSCLLFAISIKFSIYSVDWTFSSLQSEGAINKRFIGNLWTNDVCQMIVFDRLQGNLIHAMIHAKGK